MIAGTTASDNLGDILYIFRSVTKMCL